MRKKVYQNEREMLRKALVAFMAQKMKLIWLDKVCRSVFNSEKVRLLLFLAANFAPELSVHINIFTIVTRVDTQSA